jgi:hypothetical protein
VRRGGPAGRRGDSFSLDAQLAAQRRQCPRPTRN